MSLADLISTLLEELFHVQHYSAIWQRRGYFHPRHSDIACRNDLFTLCSKFQDEYVAIRWKASVMASIPLVEAPDGGKTVAYLGYGLPIAPLLDQAAANLSQIIYDAASKKLSVGDVWPKLRQVVYQEIFEPLARDAAFQTAMPLNADVPDQVPSESWFYQQDIASYWRQIRTQLERSFNNDLEEEDAALYDMTNILEAFLREMGVTCHKTSSDDSYVLFKSFT